MRYRWLFALALALGLIAAACGSSESTQAEGCFYRGQVYPIGSEFAAGDGCNRCECTPELEVVCTERACPDADIPDAGSPTDAGGADGGDAGDAGDVGDTAQ